MITLPNRPDAIMLIGLPGAGKSTWATPYFNQGYHLVSADPFIEAAANIMGVTYGNIFKATFGAATKLMELQLKLSIEKMQNIVWDQTNLTLKSRHSKLELLNDAGYNVTAVAFEIDEPELERRRLKREQETGKKIEPTALHRMAKTYVRPTRLEGFAKVIIVTPEGEIEDTSGTK